MCKTKVFKMPFFIKTTLLIYLYLQAVIFTCFKPLNSFLLGKIFGQTEHHIRPDMQHFLIIHTKKASVSAVVMEIVVTI